VAVVKYIITAESASLALIMRRHSLTVASTTSSLSSSTFCSTSFCCSTFSSSFSCLSSSYSYSAANVSCIEVDVAVCGGGVDDRRQLDLACQSRRQSHECHHQSHDCRLSSSSASSSSVMRERCSVSIGNVSRSSYSIMLLGILGWIITIATSTTQGKAVLISIVTSCGTGKV